MQYATCNLQIENRTYQIFISMLLRPWTLADADDLAFFANNREIAKNMTDAFPHPYTKEDALRFINMTLVHSPTQVFCIEVDGRPGGGIGIFPQSDILRKNAELGYWLAEPHWGKGIMSSIIPQMVEYAFRTWDITRIYARPYGSNIGSQRVLEKAGFTLEARLEKTIFKWDEFQDELIYALRRENWRQV